MNIRDYVVHLAPNGTNAYSIIRPEVEGATPSPYSCPNWPPDLFAVVASIIERSACYTSAAPNRNDLTTYAMHLDRIDETARLWNGDPAAPPSEIVAMWETMLTSYGETLLNDVCQTEGLVNILLAMFAVADEACTGMGWDVDTALAKEKPFASVAMGSMADALMASELMRHLPTSFCAMVPPDRAIVLPKALTPSVGCTVRSLSHYLALLPPATVLKPSWIWSTSQRATADRPDPKLPYDVRILLVPFPFTVDADSFDLSYPRTSFGTGRSMPAYFRLNQRWLQSGGTSITGEQLAQELVIPLIERSYFHSGAMPDGIVLPECALTSEVAKQLVESLKENDINIEFLITGVLDSDPDTGATYNRAQTFVLREEGAVKREHNKHHRWRLDAGQVERYALDFDKDDGNSQWWEDIDIGNRELPFFGLRKDMSITTLICEDLARADPAINVIRAMGPNLVIALLMDGPQLANRWPGRYATVLADDPGSAVLSFTSSGMVDRSNWLESRPARSVGLWRDASGRTQEIALPHGGLGVLLTLESVKKRQTTLDGRTDNELARQLKLRNMVPLFLADRPNWI